jgi:hypothetical protein
MTEISITFQGPNWGHIRFQMYEALGIDHPAQASTAPVGFPVDEDNGEGGYDEGPGPGEITPTPAPAPAPPRSHKKRAKAPEPEPAPEPVTEPEPEPEPSADMPTIEALKATVTQAVRLAQKKEGPTKILELLPEFKTKTGLGFVMDAEEKHRNALAGLIEAAGLI